MSSLSFVTCNDNVPGGNHSTAEFSVVAGATYRIQVGGVRGASGLLRVQLTAADDTDGDGCTDVRELGDAELLGGRRDPLNRWDFYDVNGTRKVDAVDINLVRANFNGLGPTPSEDVIYDRRVGTQVWAPGAPDGKINAVDVNLVRAEFNHSCQPTP